MLNAAQVMRSKIASSLSDVWKFLREADRIPQKSIEMKLKRMIHEAVFDQLGREAGLVGSIDLVNRAAEAADMVLKASHGDVSVGVIRRIFRSIMKLRFIGVLALREIAKELERDEQLYRKLYRDR